MFTCRDGVAICRLRAFLHARPKIGFFFFQKGTFFFVAVVRDHKPVFCLALSSQLVPLQIIKGSPNYSIDAPRQESAC